MSAIWLTRKLHEIADIRVSNVDKKNHPSEIQIRLCNYMDVYSNDYVTDRINFMDASATKAEIERFGLQVGDVVITKDSETPNDIGIPTVISDEIANLVCGYHLALIRPDSGKLDSIYLAKQLSTSQTARFFSLQASGSTRYGLPIGAIESVTIPTPPLPEQTKIAEILSTVDKAIEETTALIAKQQRIKTGLMQDLLTRGIDEHGNLRSEQTHKFKDSPLGRIPVEWEATRIVNFAMLQRGHDITESQLQDGIYPVVSSGGIVGYHNQATSSGPNVVVGRKGTIGKVHYLDCEFWAHDTSLYVINFFGNIPRYIYFLFLKLDLARYGTKSGSPSLNRNDIHPLWVGRPSKAEQIKIVEILQEHYESVNLDQVILHKLHSLKSALMQDLLTGKKRVNSLLKMMEASE